MTSKLWTNVIRPAMFSLDAERAHEIGIAALKLGVGKFGLGADDVEFGEIERFGFSFSSPLGVAAGFDKNGVVVKQLASLGFGFVEVGTVTFAPQPGNPRPRLFRLPEDRALINRLGFNNDGAIAIAERLRKLDRNCIVGINIGRNRAVPNDEATENYLKCFGAVHAVADYVVVNVSSPNTPNLRELQQADKLEELIGSLKTRNFELGAKPLLVKIAPDLTDAEIEEVVDIALKHELSGIVATNTTTSREGLTTKRLEQIGDGGLSGMPLTKRSTDAISKIFRYSKGKLAIIGVGGIFTAEDAFEKIAAGASLLQAYTGFIYGGPSFARDINKELAAILRERGFTTIDKAVGSAVKD